jgi:hypothetical protein
MTALRILAIYLVASLITVFFIWPGIADRMNGRKEKKRSLQDLYDAEVWIAINKEIDLERARFEIAMMWKASLVLAMLDQEAQQDFANEVDAAVSILQYRAASDGKWVA